LQSQFVVTHPLYTTPQTLSMKPHCFSPQANPTPFSIPTLPYFKSSMRCYLFSVQGFPYQGVPPRESNILVHPKPPHHYTMVSGALPPAACTVTVCPSPPCFQGREVPFPLICSTLFLFCFFSPLSLWIPTAFSLNHRGVSARCDPPLLCTKLILRGKACCWRTHTGVPPRPTPY